MPPTLELDLKSVLTDKNEFVLCLSYFSSGGSTLKIKLEGVADSVLIGIEYYKCINTCEVYLYFDDQSFLIAHEVSNRWIFLCIAFDLLNQEISIAIASKAVFNLKLENVQLKVPNDIKKIKIWWENVFIGYKFPEKIALLNIHSMDRTVDKYTCGDPGDLYSWKLEGWKSVGSGQNLTIPISSESSHQTCRAEFQVYSLPKRNFYDALTLCQKINGYLYYEDEVFQELINLEGKRTVTNELWNLPYTDEMEEGVFRNVYSNLTFRNVSEYYAPGQPNGGKSDNCLSWFSKGLWDVGCNSIYRTLCMIPKDKPHLVLRGLCPESQFEKFYTAGNDDGKFIWKGHRFGSIQYTDRWIFHNIINNVWAESEATYESLLIGTNAWTIHNDKRCLDKLNVANLSLRSDNILKRIFIIYIIRDENNENF